MEVECEGKKEKKKSMMWVRIEKFGVIVKFRKRVHDPSLTTTYGYATCCGWIHIISATPSFTSINSSTQSIHYLHLHPSTYICFITITPLNDSKYNTTSYVYHSPVEIILICV